LMKYNVKQITQKYVCKNGFVSIITVFL